MSPVADCNLTTYMTEAVSSKDKQSLLRTFFGCLSNGLQYLHDSKIRHRDVKPENILVKGANVLWTDFGISFDWEELGRSTTTADSAKSPMYCAPEVANCEPRNSSSDIWSLGCVFLEMTTILKGHTIAQMRQCFRDYSENHRFYANLKPAASWIKSLHNVGSEHDNEPLKWVKAMLNVTPQYRPTADALYGMITDEYTVTTAVLTPGTFCGSCCVEVNESASESDGDA
jgi:serine/threonine protein kinase